MMKVGWVVFSTFHFFVKNHPSYFPSLEFIGVVRGSEGQNWEVQSLAEKFSEEWEV